jgi:hypothetical protein
MLKIYPTSRVDILKLVLLYKIVEYKHGLKSVSQHLGHS